MKKSFLNSLLSILALLRAMDWTHRTSHWRVFGDNYYSDHLLFEKLYENTLEEADELAEKIIGFTDSGSIDPVALSFRISTFVEKWSHTGCPHQASLEAEKELQELLVLTYLEMKDKPDLTLGLDDYLMSLANTHERSLYLLQQRLRDRLMGAKTASSNPSQTDEEYFRNLPRYEEVNQLYQSGVISNLEGYSKKKDSDVKLPPTPIQIIKKDPFAKDLSTLGRYVVETPSRKVSTSYLTPGLDFITTEDSFLVTHVPSGETILDYKNVPYPVMNPETFLELANRILRDMDWTESEFIIEVEKIRELQRRFHNRVHLTKEKGATFYKIRTDLEVVK